MPVPPGTMETAERARVMISLLRSPLRCTILRACSTRVLILKVSVLAAPVDVFAESTAVTCTMHQFSVREFMVKHGLYPIRRLWGPPTNWLLTQKSNAAVDACAARPCNTVNGSCSNTAPGQYQCACLPGFAGDGRICVGESSVR